MTTQQKSLIALPSLASDPSVGLIAGTQYYNTVLKALRVYDGTSWDTIAADAATAVTQSLTTTAATYVTGSGFQVPANILRVGSFIRVTSLISGLSSTATLTASGKAGSAGTVADPSPATIATVAASSASVSSVEVVAKMCVRSIGASGSIIGTVKYSSTGLNATTLSGISVPATTTAINTTLANFFGLALTASVANIFTVQDTLVEYIV